jgi:Ran GTPase-activating protein (RanGAP) involved in mRNA processing and transport|tara:strand:+ start:871 stop:1233 length:363 start_codon:yes stop_codon:yes gene_type:complete
MTPNRSLKKINVTKTEVTDKVCIEISEYLKQPGLLLHDLNLSRNMIAADGLIALSSALQENTSLISLNLAQNLIREGGVKEFVDALKVNKTLEELCLSLNKINNTGLEAFSGFLKDNSTL